MYPDIEEILYSEDEIAQRTKELAEQIDQDYNGKEIITIGLLKGALFFMADLLRILKTPLTLDLMSVSSYGDKDLVSSGKVKIQKDFSLDIKGKDILIVEDIIDTGLTLVYIKDHLLKNGAKSVKICTLLDKPANRKFDIESDYNGFIIPNEFVVGYGLGFANRYRNLSYVGILKPEIYKQI